MTRKTALLGFFAALIVTVVVLTGMTFAAPRFISPEGIPSMAITTSRLTFGLGSSGDPTGTGYLLATGPGHFYLSVRSSPGIAVSGQTPVALFSSYRVPPGVFEIDLADGQELWGIMVDDAVSPIYMDWMLVP